jgi:hypothetical protein
MWEVIVPVQFLVISVNFVAVGSNQCCIEIEFFPYAEPDVPFEKYLAFCGSCVRTVRLNHNGRSLNIRAVKKP